MDYTKIIKKSSRGEEVKYIQNCLNQLGYSCGQADGIFGTKTENAVVAYQKSHKDIFGKKLVADGIVGEKTWTAIQRDCKSKSEPKQQQEQKTSISYTRLLKYDMTGEDVRYMKDCLFDLKYYDSDIKQIKSNTFGSDTVTAVKRFQKENKDLDGKSLTVDGIIGKKTWYAIEDVHKNGKKPAPQPEPINLDDYKHISADKREKIAKDLEQVSDLRKKIVLEILDYAYDKDVPGDVRALYLFGANLYNSDLKINYADKEEVERLAKRNPNYFNGGRKEWMLEQIKKNPKLPASDCSGMEVGYMREHGLVKPTFDTTANGLCGNGYSTEVAKSDLKPGDWVGKSGHIGTYVGGGYVVEFYGGAYGCQLTDLNNRRGYDFITKKVVKGSAWTKFRRPRAF